MLSDAIKDVFTTTRQEINMLNITESNPLEHTDKSTNPYFMTIIALSTVASVALIVVLPIAISLYRHCRQDNQKNTSNINDNAEEPNMERELESELTNTTNEAIDMPHQKICS